MLHIDVYPDADIPQVTANDLAALQLRLDSSEIDVAKLNADERDHTNDSLAGVITAISAERSSAGTLLSMAALTARVRRHGPIIAYAGVDPTGYLPLLWGDELVKIGIRLTIDEGNGVATGDIFFDEGSDLSEYSAEGTLVPRLARTLFAQYGYRVRVSFAREDGQPRRYNFSLDDLKR